MSYYTGYIINVKVDALEKDSFKLRPANEWGERERRRELDTQKKLGQS